VHLKKNQLGRKEERSQPQGGGGGWTAKKVNKSREDQGQGTLRAQVGKKNKARKELRSSRKGGMNPKKEWDTNVARLPTRGGKSLEGNYKRSEVLAEIWSPSSRNRITFKGGEREDSFPRGEHPRNPSWWEMEGTRHGKKQRGRWIKKFIPSPVARPGNHKQ